jgi:hypothetical protein
MSVWQEPAQGRRLVRRLEIDGDAEGDLAQGCFPRDAGTPTTLTYRASASAVLKLPRILRGGVLRAWVGSAEASGGRLAHFCLIDRNHFRSIDLGVGGPTRATPPPRPSLMKRFKLPLYD